MNFSTVIKAFDTMMALRDVARRMTGGEQPRAGGDSGLMQSQSPGMALGGQVETRLTNVVMAALKEAFDRDHARMELERAQLEEQRRRAEEAMRQELRRQAADRELARLRMLCATALVGWIAAVALFVARMNSASISARAVMAAGWLLLLASFATAFASQAKVGDRIIDGGDTAEAAKAGSIAVWLLTAGLALAAGSLMF
jgi:hypothetical protein